jgi:hypothetical protein
MNGPPRDDGGGRATHPTATNESPQPTTSSHDSRPGRQDLCQQGRVISLSGRHAARTPMPPVGQTPDLETVFTGTLLWSSPADAAAVLELVADDDLESPALSVLVATIRRLAVAGKPCDAQMTLDELGRDGGVHRGIALALMDATASGAVPQASRFYAAAVVAGSLRRRVESAGHALIAAAEDAAESNLAATVSRATVACLDCAGRLAELRGDR